MLIEQLLKEYTDWNDGSRRVNFTHQSFEDLDKKLQNYLENVLYVLTLNDFQKPPEEYNEQMINCLRLFEISLKENNCTDQNLQIAIESARVEIQGILDLPNLTDSQYAWFMENGFRRSEILKFVKENNLSLVWNSIYDNLDTNKEVLGFNDREICDILKKSKGVERLKSLIDFCLNCNDEIINFRASSRLINLVKGEHYKDKLEYLSDVENLKRLKDFGFNNYSTLFMFERDWKLKMNYLWNEKNMQWLIEVGFDANSLHYIIMFPEWRKKLDYLKDNSDILQKFKSAGFAPDEIAKLLYPQKWRSEIKYLEDESYIKRLKESGLTCTEIANGWMRDWDRSKIKGEIFRRS